MLQWHTRSAFFISVYPACFQNTHVCLMVFFFYRRGKGSDWSQTTEELHTSKDQPETVQGVSECLVYVCIVQFGENLSSLIGFMWASFPKHFG